MRATTPRSRKAQAEGGEELGHAVEAHPRRGHGLRRALDVCSGVLTSTGAHSLEPPLEALEHRLALGALAAKRLHAGGQLGDARLKALVLRREVRGALHALEADATSIGKNCSPAVKRTTGSNSRRSSSSLAVEGVPAGSAKLDILGVP
jgi:hypothetical protein